MLFIPVNGQIWFGAPLVVLQSIFMFFHCVVCNFLFEKSPRSHSDIGKMTESFSQNVSLKIFNCQADKFDLRVIISLFVVYLVIIK